MSLPKRDGVHDRYYLIHKPDTSPEVLAEADLCIQDVLNGTARENHSAYPTVVRNHNGTPFLPDQLLERYLTGLPLKGFPCEDAASLCDAMRRLVGWQEIRYTLEKYIEKQVQERYFEAGEKEDDFTPYPPCTVWPELRPEDVDEACCALPAMWRSAIRCMGRVLNPSPLNTSLAWFPRFVLIW